MPGVTAFTVFELLRENQLGGIKLPPSPPTPPDIRVSNLNDRNVSYDD